MTRYEAEGAYALSLAKHNRVQPDVLTELKAGMLKKSNLLNLHRGTESFADLGGLGNLKDFCRRALQPGKAVKPRGVLLLGVPGTGKSAYAKASATKPGGQRCSWMSARCWAALLDGLSKTSDKPCASPMR